MEKTIAKMKIGEQLVFGHYTSSRREYTNPDPIVWLKASKDCDFISRDVIDSLVFDAREGNGFWYGNADYSLSNIRQFLNSESDTWFKRQHENDNPPPYSDHFGFLYYFDDYEIAGLVEREGSLIRLPAVSDVLNDETKFSLFKQKGVRGKASTDYISYHYIDSNIFVSYWLRPESTGGEISPTASIPILGRNGQIKYVFPRKEIGIRPVCSINPSLVVENVDNDVVRVVPFRTNNNICTDDELIDFLGVKIS